MFFSTIMIWGLVWNNPLGLDTKGDIASIQEMYQLSDKTCPLPTHIETQKYFYQDLKYEMDGSKTNWKLVLVYKYV